MWGEAKPFPTEEEDCSPPTIAFKVELVPPSYSKVRLVAPSTESYRSTSGAFLNLPLRRGWEGTAVSGGGSGYGPGGAFGTRCTQGGMVPGVPGYHGTPPIPTPGPWVPGSLLLFFPDPAEAGFYSLPTRHFPDNWPESDGFDHFPAGISLLTKQAFK